MPPELDGINIEEHPCEVLCRIEVYRRGLEALVAKNHPVFSQMATDVLKYCAEGIIEACASGYAACLSDASEKQIQDFTAAHMVASTPYFPRP